MATTVISAGRHRCDLPLVADYEPGTVVECDSCGRQWKNKQPGNPDYATWRRTWFRRDPVERRLNGRRVPGGFEFDPPPKESPREPPNPPPPPPPAAPTYEVVEKGGSI